MKTFEIQVWYWCKYSEEESEKEFNFHNVKAKNLKQALKIASELYKYPIELIYKNETYKL